MFTIRDDGRSAYNQGLSRAWNPYEFTTHWENWHEWDSGWLDGKREMEREADEENAHTS